MSRLSHESVWYQYHTVNTCAVCPVCLVNKMYRDDHLSWNKEHIIRLSLGGPDIYPNLIPICRTCNLSMGKNFHNTYEYMVKLGRITIQQADFLVNVQKVANTVFDPICNQTQKNGLRCKNLKGGKNEIYCWKHIKEEVQPMDLDEY